MASQFIFSAGRYQHSHRARDRIRAGQCNAVGGVGAIVQSRWEVRSGPEHVLEAQAFGHFPHDPQAQPVFLRPGRRCRSYAIGLYSSGCPFFG